MLFLQEQKTVFVVFSSSYMNPHHDAIKASAPAHAPYLHPCRQYLQFPDEVPH